ncbi:MAG: hypothetical protein AAF645_29390 [Myxococcota bacterium]
MDERGVLLFPLGFEEIGKHLGDAATPAPAPMTEEAATSIGDGGVAEEPASGAPVLYPTQDEIDAGMLVLMFHRSDRG